MNYSVLTKYVCGIDLHAKKMTICVMDSSGKILLKKNIACEMVYLIEAIKPWRNDITVGVESTYNWYWLIDGLKEQNIPCVLGHALYISKRAATKHKNDPVDAQGIADLLRTNRFPVAYDYPKDMRSVRDLLRRRHFFARKRAGTKTHFQVTLHQEGYTGPLRNSLQAKSKRSSLLKLTDNTDIRENLSVDLEFISALDTLLLELEKKIIKRAQFHNRKHYNALLTIPGCGATLALTVLYETHTINRFPTPQCYSSYCRVIKADNSSAGKDLGMSKKDKIGNPHLKWAMSEIGQCMIKNYPQASAWYQEKSQMYGKSGAHARLRHKIAVSIYHMLKDNRVFDIDKFFGLHSGQAENPAHNWTESPGQISEPPCVIEHPSDRSNSKYYNRKARNKIPGRRTLRTTGKRKVLAKSGTICV